MKGHTGPVLSASFSPDGRRIVTGSPDKTVKVWDVRTGAALTELEGNSGGVYCVSFSPDCKRIVASTWDKTAMVWGTRTHELDLGDKMPMQRTTDRFKERNNFPADPRFRARTGFHNPPLAKSPYDRPIFQILAVNSDRLSKRIVAQESLREGKPKWAIPHFFECMLSRPITSPPVEELLLAQADLDLNRFDEANRFYRAATDWLDRPCKPIRAINIDSHCALNPWAGLGEAFARVDNPRRNPFDWVNWHECDLFRAEVERTLAGK